MTRVMQVMAGAVVGGAETFFVDLVTALHRAGLEQKVVIRRNERRARQLRDAGLEPVELAFGSPLDMVSGPRLAEVIRAWRPDVLQSWMNRATRFVSRPPGVPRFVHVGWFGGYYKVSNYRHCDHLIGVTPDIRDHQVAGGWDPARAHYLPTLARSETAPPLKRETFATPPDAPLFLALGRLHPKKAFDTLIRAAARIPAAHVWIAGEGELREPLTRLIAEQGVGDRVKLLGWRDDRAALFAAADFCVMPSRYEPFGTVMIEAWAQGVPLICARAKGPLGLVRDGVDGLLVPIDDEAALAAAMSRLIDDPALAAALAAAGRAAYEDTFTEAAVVARYRAFYDRINAP